MTGERTSPRPEVLARLAEGLPLQGTGSRSTPGAHTAGIVLRIVTAASVLAAVLIAGSP